MGCTVCVVDDDALQLNLTKEALEEHCHYDVITALGGRAAIEYFLLRSGPRPDVVLLDLMMPEISGLAVVKAIRRSDAHVPIILMTPPNQSAQAMEAIRAGANDCLQKPVHLSFLKMVIERQVQREQMRRELERLERYQQSRFCFDDIKGKSQVMQLCVKKAMDAARQPFALLLEGEPGTGKELFARVIHSQSRHHDAAFVTVPCAYPHRFWDAIKANASLDSLIEQGIVTDGETVFLRHLDALDASRQDELVKFLLSLASGQTQRGKPLRFIASSREPLQALYRKDKLHDTLYHYFAGQVIALPPLRERGEDLALLANFYLRRFTATYPFCVHAVDDKAAQVLSAQTWPGNVQELVGFMQRAAYYAHEPQLGNHIVTTLLARPDMPMMTTGQMPSPEHHGRSQVQYSLLTGHGEVKSFEQIEAEIIRFAIRHYRGKMTEVARKLGIGRSTLYRKIQDYNLRDMA